jgi:hypothetical protein
VDIDLHGAATFFSIPKLAGVLDAVPRGSVVHVHIEHLGHVDHACLEMLQSWARQHEATGGELILEWRDLEQRYAAPQNAAWKQPRPAGHLGAGGRANPGVMPS